MVSSSNERKPKYLHEIPFEIWAKIFSHAELIGPQSGCKNCKYSRKYQYKKISLVCKHFYYILRDPWVQAEWIRSYCGRDLCDSLFLACKLKWVEALNITCQYHRSCFRFDAGQNTNLAVQDFRWKKYKLEVLDTSLVFAFCQYLPHERKESASLSSSTIKKNQSITDKSNQDLMDIISYYGLESSENSTQTLDTKSDSGLHGLEDQTLLQDDENSIYDIIELYHTPPTTNNLNVPRFKRVNHFGAHKKFSQTETSTGVGCPISSDSLKDNSLKNSDDLMVAIVEILLNYGANISTMTEFCLRRAALYKSKALLELCLKRGADVKVLSNEPMRNCIQRNFIEGVEMLLNNGACLYDAVMECCRDPEYLNSLRYLFRDGNRAVRHYVEEFFQSNEFIYLKNYKYSPNWFDDNWLKHPLVYSVAMGNLKAFRYILETMCQSTGIGSHYIENENKYPIETDNFSEPFVCLLEASLRFACKGGQDEILKVLLKFDLDFWSAARICIEYRQRRLLDIICQQEAHSSYHAMHFDQNAPYMPETNVIQSENSHFANDMSNAFSAFPIGIIRSNSYSRNSSR